MFSSTLFGNTGVLIVLVASLVGTVQYFRRSVSLDARRLRPAVITVAALLTVLGAISAVVTALNVGDVSAEEAQGAVMVTAKKAGWDVKMIEATTGQQIRIVVRNDDPILHTFTTHDLGIDERLGPWTEKLIEIESEARIYGYICRVPGHEEDMTGAIVVE